MWHNVDNKKNFKYKVDITAFVNKRYNYLRVDVIDKLIYYFYTAYLILTYSVAAESEGQGAMAPHFSKVPILAPSLFACEKRLCTASGQVFVAIE